MDRIRQTSGSPPPPPPPLQPADPQVMEKLKIAAVNQAGNQSLGTYKIVDSEATKYGNFLIPIVPREP